MSQFYFVPVVINGVLRHMEIEHVPVNQELNDGTVITWSLENSLVHQAKRMLAKQGHDRYIIKQGMILSCQL